MKLCWGSELAKRTGNAYGYWTHNTTLRQHVSKIIDLEPDPNIATDIIYILSPEFFNPDSDMKARTWLFTMFEGTTIPDKYYQSMKHADFFLTPSTWVKSLFEKYFEAERIFVVNHGVTSDFKLRKRKFPKGKPFRYLYVGAPNPRKGYEEVITAWSAAFHDKPHMELYIKTTGIAEWRLTLDKMDNVIIDGRDLSMKELIALYQSAHCFVFATRGEGFGLTLAEAMRTGLPCIATACTGVLDFFDSKVGYPIGYKMGKANVTFIGDNVVEETEVAFPNVEELIEQMIYVYLNYIEAVKKGKIAHQRIMSKFTWQRSAMKLIDILENN